MRDSLSRATEKFGLLKKQVGNTPLYEISKIPIPNENRIFAKEEFESRLTGSHYDRIYIYLLEKLEQSGKISPDKVQLIETSSGNAGEAFAITAIQLGYTTTVVIPENTPSVRLEAIQESGARVVKTSAELGMKGAQHKLQCILEESKKKTPLGELPFYCPNHSRNELSLKAISSLANEVLDESPVKFDIFVAAIGNGLSILGPATYLKNNGLKIVGWDPIQAPRGFTMKYPGQFEKSFGMKAGELGPHCIFGTGVMGIDFPFLETAIFGNRDSEAVVDEIMTVVDYRAIKVVSELVGIQRLSQNALNNVRRLPNLTSTHMSLLELEQKPVGPSSAGSLAVALDIADRIHGQNILILFYDRIRKYM